MGIVTGGTESRIRKGYNPAALKKQSHSLLGTPRLIFRYGMLVFRIIKRGPRAGRCAPPRIRCSPYLSTEETDGKAFPLFPVSVKHLPVFHTEKLSPGNQH